MHSSFAELMSRTNLRSRIGLTIVIALLLALGVAIYASSSVLAAFSCVNDTAGANDEPEPLGSRRHRQTRVSAVSLLRP